MIFTGLNSSIPVTLVIEFGSNTHRGNLWGENKILNPYSSQKVSGGAIPCLITISLVGRHAFRSFRNKSIKIEFASQFKIL